MNSMLVWILGLGTMYPTAQSPRYCRRLGPQPLLQVLTTQAAEPIGIAWHLDIKRCKGRQHGMLGSWRIMILMEESSDFWSCFWS